MRKDNIEKLCLDFLGDNGLAIDEKVIKRLIQDEKKIISNTDLEISNNVCIAFVDNNSTVSEINKLLDKEVLKSKENPNEDNNFGMLILTSTVEFNNKINDLVCKPKYNDFDINVVMTGRKTKKKEYTIEIKSRIQALYNEIEVPQTSKQYERVTGSVYSANLYDIVEIYDQIGNDLFEKNVRYQIVNDKFGVGNRIINTLKNNPNQFWFNNNGITIVTDYEIDKSLNNAIILRDDNKHNFSVVNGAQTLTAAHRFFFSDDDDGNKEEAKNAKVLLRVVSVEAKDYEEEKKDIKILDTKESMGERISKSLNSQKPIEAEDLAYYSTFVKKINELYLDNRSEQKEDEKDNRFFGIIRRGEEGGNSFEHSLTRIARAIMASGYINDNGIWEVMPWKAVNTYNASILKVNGSKLKNSLLFKEIEDKDGFLKNYQGVNLAIYLYECFAVYKNSIKIDDYKNANTIELIKSRGNWYFVTFFFESLLNYSNTQELQVDYIDNFSRYVDNDQLKKIIEFFFEVIDEMGDKTTLKELRNNMVHNDIARILKDKEEQLKNCSLIAKRLLVINEE